MYSCKQITSSDDSGGVDYFFFFFTEAVLLNQQVVAISKKDAPTQTYILYLNQHLVFHSAYGHRR